MGRVLNLLGLGERSRESGAFSFESNSAMGNLRSRVRIVSHGVANITSEVVKLDLQESTKVVMRGEPMPVTERATIAAPTSEEVLKAAGVQAVPFVPENRKHPTEAEILEKIADIHARDDVATQVSMPHLARVN